MNILLVGARGQLGKKILETKPSWAEVDAFTQSELDIKNEELISNLVSKKKYDALINCAAYTLVDKAETEVQEAFEVNCSAVEKISKICYENKILLIHYSTDYVFSGETNSPYNELQEISPLNTYGKSKAQGEIQIKESGCNFAIIRTSWLYAEFGQNFLRTIATRLLMNNSLRVVADQIGSPTYAGDLATFSWELISNINNQKHQEIYHFSNEGVASWYDFAFEIGEILGKPNLVSAITTREYPTPAKRPFLSLFDKSKIKLKLNKPIRHWKEALREAVVKYKELENL
jgi:dTDP-4-dehydrorhamnose reductase